MADEKAKAKGSDAKDPEMPPPRPFEISGRAGGPFNINGEQFGSGGELLVAGRHVPTTRWNDFSIKGQMPYDIKEGAVEVKPTGGESQTGEWPPKKVAGQVPKYDPFTGKPLEGRVARFDPITGAPLPVDPDDPRLSEGQKETLGVLTSPEMNVPGAAHSLFEFQGVKAGGSIKPQLPGDAVGTPLPPATTTTTGASELRVPGAAGSNFERDGVAGGGTVKPQLPKDVVGEHDPKPVDKPGPVAPEPSGPVTPDKAAAKK